VKSANRKGDDFLSWWWAERSGLGTATVPGLPLAGVFLGGEPGLDWGKRGKDKKGRREAKKPWTL